MPLGHIGQTKKLRSALLVVVLTCVAAILPASFASALTITSGSNILTYTDNGTAGTITGCATTCSGSLVIPSSDGTNPITAVASSAFLSMTITSVTIPSSVTSIGDSAFSSDTSLSSVSWPSSVTSIGNYEFQNDTALTSFTIPSSVTSIGSDAFSGTGLTTVTIPSSVTTLSGGEFGSDVSLHSVTVSNSLVDGAEFENDTALTTVTLSSAVTTLGGDGFMNDTALTTVTIPSSVTTLGNSLFQGDTALTTVTIPSSVTSIGSYAFYETGLTSVTIPSSVTTLSGEEFDGDTALTTVTIQNATTSALEFYDDTNLTSLSLGSNLSSINTMTFSRDTSLASVTIPSSVTGIGQQAFSGDTLLSSVTIPSSVTSILTQAFYNTGLTSVTIPSSVTTLTNSVFSHDAALTTVTIPSSVTGIQASAFSADSLLTNVYFLGNAPTFFGSSGTFSGSGHYYYVAGATGWNATIATAMLPLTPVGPPDAYSYNTNGGSAAPSSGSGTDGTTITLASAPTKSGSIFGGWSDGTSTYAAGATYTLASDGSAIVFSAQWVSTAPQYVMDYFSYSDPSLGVVPQNGIGIDNTPITLAAAPIRSGYTFGGWNDGVKTYPAGAKYVLASAGNAILFTAQWTLNATPMPTAPAAPQITSVVGTKNGLVTTFSPTDSLATSFLCRISNGHNVFVRASTMSQSPSQTSYVCAFGTLYAPRRYRVWVTALNQYGSSPFASTTAVTQH